MLNFQDFILVESSMSTPEHMKKTFDNYLKYSGGNVSIDKRNRNRLNFYTKKRVAEDIIHIIDSKLGFMKNKLFTTSPITRDENTKQFTFSIIFN